MGEYELPYIVRNLSSIESEHETALAAVKNGDGTSDILASLARTDRQITAFADTCRRVKTMHLMSAGLSWGDELRHPALPEKIALVRTRDLVEIQGQVMTILAATHLIAQEAQKGISIAAWQCGSIRLGTALGLEHYGTAASPPSPNPDAIPVGNDQEEMPEAMIAPSPVEKPASKKPAISPSFRVPEQPSFL